MPYICPVCGFPDLLDPPRSKSGGGSYEICPSCRFQFGYHDDAYTYEEWRQRWIKDGMGFWAYWERPRGWDPVEQLRNLVALGADIDLEKAARAADATRYRADIIAKEFSKDYHWARPETLYHHSVRHDKDFGATGPASYARKAQEFLRRARAEGLPTKIDSEGVIRIYEPATNTFGAYNADGATKAFFKPSTGRRYFDRQPGNSSNLLGGIEMPYRGLEMPYICPVCGFPDLLDPPRSKSGGGSYENCPCCGFEFGYDDDDRGFTYEEWRQQWIEGGMLWRERPAYPPFGWDPVEQLRNLEKLK
ncbi:conserved protein of unknown function [Methylacidimicrobium sp. AP8]|uniref:hypothetical protein n=1 Tax=Methylacidimicrobium sp. AP8 TaxID=2730359 RepID=UPI0018C1BABD|nr:hypothetical protein [Methylacidimicrobium sp. AP8]CAB4243599.1 conserved protein of unknown function [Methylacidimicrobium sp. AP8]